MAHNPVHGRANSGGESGTARPRPTLGFLLANIHIGIGRSLWPAIVQSVARRDVNLISFPGGGLRAAEQSGFDGYPSLRSPLLVTPEAGQGNEEKGKGACV
ncbi:MAG: hypothetical protein JW929_13580 [Anaerolineales bacterium]|nr:hypothetical protein [Anaerolineales bacterium]